MNIVEEHDVSTRWAYMVGGCVKKHPVCFVVIEFGVSRNLTAVESKHIHNPHSLSFVQAELCVPDVQKGSDSTRELCICVMRDPWPRFFFPSFLLSLRPSGLSVGIDPSSNDVASCLCEYHNWQQRP